MTVAVNATDSHFAHLRVPVGQPIDPIAKADEVRRVLGGLEYPVDVERVAAKLGARVRYLTSEEQLGWNGAIVMAHRDVRLEEPVIYVRESDAPELRRFTVAHELGHLLLHWQEKAFYDAYDGRSSPQESEANLFAFHLLVPAEAMLSTYLTDAGHPERLAWRFGIPESMMRQLLRLRGLPG